MKRTLALLLAALFVLLIGCGSEYRPVKPVGEVPEEFVPLIESGLLRKYGAIAAANGFLDSDGKDEDGDYNIDYMEFVRYDAYGREQARRRYPQDEYHGHWVMLNTADDGFLTVYGYQPRFDLEAGGWDVGDDVSSEIIKFDRLCNVEWTLTVPDCGAYSLKCCVETGNGYVFCGERETTGRFSVDHLNEPSEIQIFRVSFAGEVTKTVTFSGSGHAALYCAAPRADGLDLYLSSTANDGDFAQSEDGGDAARTYWIFRLDDDLNCISKEPVRYDAKDRSEYSYYFDSYYFYHLVGYLDGTAVYSDDPRFADADDQRIPVYDGGEVLALMDYGTFYLIVSYNLTGEIEGIPPESSRWRWTTETVYTAFDKDGDILWRTAVDNAE